MKVNQINLIPCLMLFFILVNFIEPFSAQEVTVNSTIETSQERVKVIQHEEGVKLENYKLKLGIATLRRIGIGLVELILTVVVGISMIYLSFLIFIKFTKDINEEEELKKNNVAVSVLVASIIFGVIILIKRSLYPVFTVIQSIAISNQFSFLLFLKALIFSVGYILISLLISFFVIGIAIKIFDKLTHNIDEFAEIKAGNLAVGIFLGTVIVALCFFIEEGLHSLLVTLIPGPQINIF